MSTDAWSRVTTFRVVTPPGEDHEVVPPQLDPPQLSRVLTISPKRLETRSSPLRNAAAASPPLPPPMYEPEHGASDVSFFGSSTQGGLRYQPPEHVVRLQSYCSGGRGDDDIEMMQFSPSPRSQRSQWSQRGSDGEGGGRVTDAKSSSRVTSFFLSWLGRAGDRSSSDAASSR
eukprot:gene8192-29150_t